MPTEKQLANLTGGSRKGVPNKSTVTMKAAIQSVYEKLQDKRGGDHTHFLEWAEEQPTEFYKLASKLIPVQMEATVNLGLADRLERAKGKK